MGRNPVFFVHAANDCSRQSVVVCGIHWSDLSRRWGVSSSPVYIPPYIVYSLILLCIPLAPLITIESPPVVLVARHTGRACRCAAAGRWRGGGGGGSEEKMGAHRHHRPLLVSKPTAMQSTPSRMNLHHPPPPPV